MEHNLAKVGVEGSNPFARSRNFWYLNNFRQAAERRPCRLSSGGASGGAVNATVTGQRLLIQRSRSIIDAARATNPAIHNVAPKRALGDTATHITFNSA